MKGEANRQVFLFCVAFLSRLNKSKKASVLYDGQRATPSSGVSCAVAAAAAC